MTHESIYVTGKRLLYRGQYHIYPQKRKKKEGFVLAVDMARRQERGFKSS